MLFAVVVLSPASDHTYPRRSLHPFAAQGEDGAAAAVATGGGGGGGGGGDGFSEFGIDPSVDPEVRWTIHLTTWPSDPSYVAVHTTSFATAGIHPSTPPPPSTWQFAWALRVSMEEERARQEAESKKADADAGTSAEGGGEGGGDGSGEGGGGGGEGGAAADATMAEVR